MTTLKKIEEYFDGHKAEVHRYGDKKALKVYMYGDIVAIEITIKKAIPRRWRLEITHIWDNRNLRDIKFLNTLDEVLHEIQGNSFDMGKGRVK